MPSFNWSARPAAGGDIKEGTIELAKKEDVIAFLHKQKLIPVVVREKPKQLNITFGTGITTRDIVIFTRQFTTMINSGLPLVQSLMSNVLVATLSERAQAPCARPAVLLQPPSGSDNILPRRRPPTR